MFELPQFSFFFGGFWWFGFGVCVYNIGKGVHGFFNFGVWHVTNLQGKKY
jgi:hypothetical protein